MVIFDTENIARKIGSYNPESIDTAFLSETLKYKYIPGAPDDLINRIEAKRKTKFIPPEYIDREIQTAPAEQKAINLTLKIFQKAINIILRPSGVEDVRRLYSHEAKSYDFKHKLTTAYNDNALRKEVADEIRNILGATSGVKSVRILDLASGTGLTLETINNTLLKTDSASMQLYGLDITEKMIEIGKKRLGNKTKIRLENGDATDFIGSGEGSNEGAYKFKPNSIDFITIVFGIGGIENSVKCFGEQLKALREGGIAIMVDMHAPSLKLDDIHMPFGLSPSPGLVRQAWEKVTKPLVLQKLWKWKDPTEDFYKMPLATYFDAERNQYFGFEVVKREVKTMKWWLSLPVMPVAKLIVKKVQISKQEFLIKQNIIH